MMKKLSRREAALVAHASRRAVEEYKAATRFRLEVPRAAGDGQRLLLVDLPLNHLESLNRLNGEPVFFYSLVSRWRA